MLFWYNTYMNIVAWYLNRIIAVGRYCSSNESLAGRYWTGQLFDWLFITEKVLMMMMITILMI